MKINITSKTVRKPDMGFFSCMTDGNHILQAFRKSKSNTETEKYVPDDNLL